jgi:hypothetical protein
VELPPVFIGSARHPHPTPALPLPRHVAPPHRPPLVPVQSSGRGAPVAPSPVTARRVHPAVLHPGGDQAAVAPAPIAAGLVATDEAGVMGSSNTWLGLGDLRRQDRESPCRPTALPRPRRRPGGAAKLPGMDAQCEREQQGRLMWGCLIQAGRGWWGHRWSPASVVQPMGFADV